MKSYYQENTRFTFELCAEDHTKLKVLAAMKRVSIKSLVLDCVKENLLNKVEKEKEKEK